MNNVVKKLFPTLSIPSCLSTYLYFVLKYGSKNAKNFKLHHINDNVEKL